MSASPRAPAAPVPRGLLAGVLLPLVWLAACGVAGLPQPVTGAHVGVDPVGVPFPPPPARVEVVPPPPDDLADPVWVDGEWAWRGRQWVWQPGQWWERPPLQVWASPAVVRLADGSLVWFEGQWRAAQPIDALPLRPAAPPR